MEAATVEVARNLEDSHARAALQGLETDSFMINHTLRYHQGCMSVLLGLRLGRLACHSTMFEPCLGKCVVD